MDERIKMKKIIVALCVALHTTGAWADRVFVSPNKGGGEITLTDRPCIIRGQNMDQLREAYTWAPNASYEKGCWGIVDGMVHVLYLVTGERRVYPLENFREKR